MKERYQGRWDQRKTADYCWTINRDLNKIEPDRQSRKRKFYHNSYVHKGFISAVDELNDLMKILAGLGIFDHVIFKDLGFDCY